MFTQTEARIYRDQHDAEVKRLNRMSKHELSDEYAAELALRGYILVSGGPGCKDEYIRAIIEFRYPAEKMDETSHVLYHKPGTEWSACGWCVYANWASETPDDTVGV